MIDRPILFSAPMVQALLAGRKTQTRRLAWRTRMNEGGPIYDAAGGQMDHVEPHEVRVGPSHWQKVQPGDRLWVRETWQVKRHEPCLDHEREWQSLLAPTIRYTADSAEQKVLGDRTTGRGVYHGPVETTRVSIHMPRWASRLTLTVTDVRVQRLQEISEDDARAEGIEPVRDIDASGMFFGPPLSRGAFASLWCTLHGPDAWDANPWIVALTFTVAQRNIDAP